jgi:hypothetical protein
MRDRTDRSGTMATKRMLAASSEQNFEEQRGELGSDRRQLEAIHRPGEGAMGQAHQ